MPVVQGLLNIYLFVSVLIAMYFSTYALSKRNTTLIKLFSALCIFASFYLLGYLLEINSNSLAQMVFWNQIQYIGIPFYPACGLLLSLIYTKSLKTLSKGTLIKVFAIPFLTFIIRLTNAYTNFYYYSFKIKSTLGLTFLAFEKGPWYLIYSYYLVFCFILTTFCYIKNYSKRVSYKHTGYRIMILASFVPFLGLLFILINPGHLLIDYCALLLPVFLFLLILSLFKYDFLALNTLARDTLFERSTDAMLLIDNTNELIDYNLPATMLFNELNENESINEEPIDIVFKNQTNFLEALKTDTKKDLKLACSNGYEYFEVKTTKIRDNQGTEVGKLITLINITERKTTEELLSALATTDSLTGLCNRSQFMRLANIEMENSINYNATFSLLMMDIDHFKKINDTKGHAAGDAVLKHLGDKVKEYFRKTDIVGRLGGEEFAVILPNTSLKYAESIAENFREKISNSPALYEDKLIHFTFSIGVVTYNENLKSLEELFKLADKGLYESKYNGRNQVTTIV